VAGLTLSNGRQRLSSFSPVAMCSGEGRDDDVESTPRDLGAVAIDAVELAGWWSFKAPSLGGSMPGKLAAEIDNPSGRCPCRAWRSPPTIKARP